MNFIVSGILFITKGIILFLIFIWAVNTSGHYGKIFPYFIIDNFNCPIFVDSKKKDLSCYENCVIKINTHEKNISKRHMETETKQQN